MSTVSHADVSDAADEETSRISGWRIRRMHLVNWGGFDGYHDVTFDSTATTLTGASGAGKSTLLDAYIALMMSSNVPFNNASNAGKGRARGEGQRTVLTYVRGVIDATVEDGETVERTLRGTANAWGAVAVSFERERPGDVGDTFTAARFWHVPRTARGFGDVTTKFVTSNTPFDLVAAEADAPQRFANLKAIYGPHVSVQGDYSTFAAKVRQRLHIGAADGGDKAMDLLANVQAGRSVHDVGGLYRDLVLEKPATFDAADEAAEHFNSLDDAYQAMVTAEQQQEALAPVRAAYYDRRHALHRVAAVDGLGVGDAGGALARWHASQVVDLATTARPGADERLDGAVFAHEAARATEMGALKRRDAARDRLRAESADLDNLKQQADEFRDQAKKVKDAYDALAAIVGPAGLDVSTAEAFTAAKREAEQVLTADDGDDDLGNRIGALQSRIRDLVSQRTETIAERDDLAARGGKISGRDHDIRKEVAAALGLTPAQLPYLAELFDVTDEAWRTAADAVLRGFAMQLVIDADAYDQVRDTLNRLTFRTRFNFVGATSARLRRFEAPAGTLASVLKVDATSPWAGWLHQQLLSQADHRLVDDVRDLVGGDNVRRVTRSGQTRHGYRGSHGGHGRQVIGFNPQHVLEQYGARIAQIEQNIIDARAELEPLEAERGQRRRRRDALAGLRTVTWDSVDVAYARGVLAEAEAEVARARRDNPALEVLESEANEADAEWKQAQGETNQARTMEDQARAALARLDELNATHQDLADAAGSGPDDAQSALLTEICSADPISLDDVDGSARRIRAALSERQRTAEQQAQKAERELTNLFRNFSTQWADPNRGVGVADAGLYLGLLENLEANALPQVRDRFLNAVNLWSGDDVNAVRSAMDTAIAEIQSRIGAINTILAGIRFGDPAAVGGTGDDRLVIAVKRAQTPTVTDFRRRLTELSAPDTSRDVAAAARRFEAYRALNDELAGPQRSELLDVRRHIDISAHRVSPDGRIVAEFRTLGGKSGGETQELIAFIVGSALRYRLGGEPTQGPPFAAVLLDEAFIKADALFAGRAVTAWLKLGFQLVIAAPIDKYTALEPHVPRTLVVRKSGGRSSIQAIVR